MNTDLTPAPTPRTDAEILTWMTFPETPQMMPPVVTSIFARGLERELLAAHKTAEELRMDALRLSWLGENYGFATKDYQTPLLRWDDTLFPTNIRDAIDKSMNQPQP